eukprot:m.892053 g.892053  ORF g.892053 m.892053 type:complete len:1350 (+) comp23654_c0_seq5:324-4373(+)
MDSSNSFGGDGSVDLKGVKSSFAEMVHGFKGYSDGKQELLKDFAAFISKRGEIEQSYSRDLQKLVDKYAAKRGRATGAGGRSVGGSLRGPSDKETSSLDSDSLGGGSSMNIAMEEVLNSTRKRSEAHNSLSQMLSTDVKAMLDQMQTEALTNARKCHVWISSIQAEYLKTLKELDDKMKAYHKEQSGFNKVEENMEKKHEKGKGYTKKGTKLKGKLAVQERKATEARNDYLISLVSSNAMREQLYQHEVEGVFDAMDFEYVQAFKNVNHEIFKAMKSAAKEDNTACDDLWKAVCDIPENEAKLNFMHKNSRCLATREITMAPSCDDNVTKLVFTNEEEGLGKFRHVEQQVCKAERDIRLSQQSIEDNCAEMAAIGGPILPPLPDDGIPQDSPAAKVTDAFGKRSHAFLNRAANLAILESIGTGLGSKRPKLLEDNGVPIISMDAQLPWTVPSTHRFVLQGETPAFARDDEGGASCLAPPPQGTGQPRPSPRSRAGATMDTKTAVRCFEESLTDIASKMGDPVPTVVESSITWLDTEEHIQLKGLFRISGGLAEVERLKTAFNNGKDPLAEHGGAYDPHAVAGCLKLFLRELPDSVFTFKYYTEWLKMGTIPDAATRILAIRELLHKHLPPEHTAVLQRLLPFLKKISLHEAVNKMSISNLATVFGPTLMPAPRGDMTAVLRDTTTVTALMTFILEHVEDIFATGTDAATGPDSKAEDTVTEEEESTVEIFKARALYDYTARAAEELSFLAGDVLSVFEKLDSNWWRGELKGERGFIAAAYVAPVESDRASLLAADYSMEHDAADDADDADDYLHVTALDGPAHDDDDGGDDNTAKADAPAAKTRPPGGVSPARPTPPAKVGGAALAKDPMQAALAAAAMAVVAGTAGDGAGNAAGNAPLSFKRPGRRPPGPPPGADGGEGDAPRKLIPTRRPPGIPAGKAATNDGTGESLSNTDASHRHSTTSEDSFCAISPPVAPPVPTADVGDATDAPPPTAVAPPPPPPEEATPPPVEVQLDTQLYQNSRPTPAPMAARRKSMADVTAGTTTKATTVTSAQESKGGEDAAPAPSPGAASSDGDAAPPMFMPPPPPPPADDTDAEHADTQPPGAATPPATSDDTPPEPAVRSSPPPAAAPPAPAPTAKEAVPPPKVTPKPRPAPAAARPPQPAEKTATVPTPTKKKAPPPVRSRTSSDGVALRRPPPTIRTKKPVVANRLSIAPDFAPPAPPPGPPTEESREVADEPAVTVAAQVPTPAATTDAEPAPPPPDAEPTEPAGGDASDDTIPPPVPPALPAVLSDDDDEFASVENLPPPPPPLEPEENDDVAPLPTAFPPVEPLDRHLETPDTEDDEIDC